MTCWWRRVLLLEELKPQCATVFYSNLSLRETEAGPFSRGRTFPCRRVRLMIYILKESWRSYQRIIELKPNLNIPGFSCTTEKQVSIQTWWRSLLRFFGRAARGTECLLGLDVSCQTSFAAEGKVEFCGRFCWCQWSHFLCDTQRQLLLQKRSALTLLSRTQQMLYDISWLHIIHLLRTSVTATKALRNWKDIRLWLVWYLQSM